MSDPAFAELLFSDADQALSGYDLTADEVTKLKALSRVEFDQATKGSPEERKSFAWMQHNETALKIH